MPGKHLIVCHMFEVWIKFELYKCSISKPPCLCNPKYYGDLKTVAAYTFSFASWIVEIWKHKPLFSNKGLDVHTKLKRH